MDFAKFTSLITSQRLNFARQDCLGDPFEGTFTKPLFAALSIQSEEVEKNKKIAGAPPLIKQLRRAYQRTRKGTYVSCWHLNETESAAMWRLYSLADQGIAIESTYSRLSNSLNSDFYIGKVRYIDFATEYYPAGNLLYPVMHKRKSFEHEKEVRAVISNIAKNTTTEEIDSTQANISFPIKFDELVTAIHVNPDSSNWYFETISVLVERLNIKTPVKRSELSNAPII